MYVPWQARALLLCGFGSLSLSGMRVKGLPFSSVWGRYIRVLQSPSVPAPSQPKTSTTRLSPQLAPGSPFQTRTQPRPFQIFLRVSVDQPSLPLALSDATNRGCNGKGFGVEGLTPYLRGLRV